MGRPGLSNHPKFLRLARALGSEALARGSLELMWEVSYESGDPRLGDAEGVEAAARWRGEPGVLFAALRDSGGPGRQGFVEPDELGEAWLVHDLFDHAPDYVRKRARREDQRRASGQSLAAERRSVTGQCPPNGNPPAPAPAPAPNYIPPTGAAGSSAPESVDPVILGVDADETPLLADGFKLIEQPCPEPPPPPRVSRATRPRSTQEAVAALRRTLSDALVADFREVRQADYAFAAGRDGRALGKLLELGRGDIGQVRRRWRWGLEQRDERSGGPPWAGRVNLIAELALESRWNALAGAPEPPPEGRRDAFEI